MSTKHTPGPWHYEETSGYVRCFEGFTVADAYEALDKSQSDINGRLIAATPALLAALRELCRQAESSLDYRPEFRAALADGLAAINQAEQGDLK